MSSFCWPHYDSACAQACTPCCSCVVRESIRHCIHSPDGRGGRRSQKLPLCWRDELFSSPRWHRESCVFLQDQFTLTAFIQVLRVLSLAVKPSDKQYSPQRRKNRHYPLFFLPPSALHVSPKLTEVVAAAVSGSPQCWPGCSCFNTLISSCALLILPCEVAMVPVL